MNFRKSFNSDGHQKPRRSRSRRDGDGSNRSDTRSGGATSLSRSSDHRSSRAGFAPRQRQDQRLDSSPPSQTTNPRQVVAEALARVAQDWPDASMFDPEIGRMEARDIRLAKAVYHTAIQRWMTLAYILDKFLKKPVREMEPLMQGVLLSGATQLLFMDRLPGHAVVDESVNLARQLVRPGAAGMANAVLRKIARLVGKVVEKPWTPDVDRLPLEGGYLTLQEPILPPIANAEAEDDQPVDLEKMSEHLYVATSHPRLLVIQWLETYGLSRTIELCEHSTLTPPVIVSIEPGCNLEMNGLEAHAWEGFAVWHGARHDLPSFLQKNKRRRVQDPASSLAVQSMATLDPAPQLILDLCAGRGTKTKQLSTLFPEAKIVASDISQERLADFEPWAKTMKQIQVVPHGRFEKIFSHQKADVILLDVPCSNTGVLARRPGAKYRYNHPSIYSLVLLQQEIMEEARRWVTPQGIIVYSTCSLEPRENQEQVAWFLRKHGGKIIHEKLTLPSEIGGGGAAYHDGSYHAFIQLG